eukprot:Selendium_serpulae@DN5661_c0_g3_i1.p1
MLQLAVQFSTKPRQNVKRFPLSSCTPDPRSVAPCFGAAFSQSLVHPQNILGLTMNKANERNEAFALAEFPMDVLDYNRAHYQCSLPASAQGNCEGENYSMAASTVERFLCQCTGGGAPVVE